MRGRNSFRIVSLKSVDRSAFYLLVLTVFFLGGCVIGCRYFEFCTEGSRTTIAEYLFDFCEAAQIAVPKGSISRTAALFYFYPVAAFFLGLSPLGILVIPILSFLLGFGFMFTVQCFLCVFSRVGIFPALALLSIRLLVTLFCFLVLAVEALPQAWRIAQVTIRNGKRSESVCHGKRYWVLAFFCLIVLTLGVCCETFFVPTLFRFSLHRIL